MNQRHIHVVAEETDFAFVIEVKKHPGNGIQISEHLIKGDLHPTQAAAFFFAAFAQSLQQVVDIVETDLKADLFLQLFHSVYPLNRLKPLTNTVLHIEPHIEEFFETETGKELAKILPGAKHAKEAFEGKADNDMKG
jgi:hypothetical protein